MTTERCPWWPLTSSLLRRDNKNVWFLKAPLSGGTAQSIFAERMCGSRDMKNRALTSAGLRSVPALPLTSCVILGRSPSEVSAPHL